MLGRGQISRHRQEGAAGMLRSVLVVLGGEDGACYYMGSRCGVDPVLAQTGE
jgi:hypothetical protein